MHACTIRILLIVPIGLEEKVHKIDAYQQKINMKKELRRKEKEWKTKKPVRGRGRRVEKKKYFLLSSL